MPTSTFGIYQGWTNERLKQRCLDLCRAVDEWRHLAMVLAEEGKAALRSDEQSRVERLVKAYQE
jgi:hypothetical protein